MKKVLVIRFSSFGDIVQASHIINPLIEKFPDVKIDWLTKVEFKNLVECFSGLNDVISFDKDLGLIGLIKLGFKLSKNDYHLVYDAHNNTRSLILRLIFFFCGLKVIKREKSRWKRVLLFRFRINKFDWPFKGALSYLKPLELCKGNNQNWNLEEHKVTLPYEKFIVLAPSAAWEMKRWPLDHWKSLIKIMKDHRFIVVGGPKDDFCAELEAIDPTRVKNVAGSVSLNQSSYIVKKSDGIVSADTGIIHVADAIGAKGISLIGPTAFGYCSGEHIKTLEVELSCKPCSKDGRGSCSQEVYQKCMVDITPERVASCAIDFFSSSKEDY
tara:strand:+ start:125573 stop:126553 length:981 start_codon:yes stop_codon:yes gene_type:complete